MSSLAYLQLLSITEKMPFFFRCFFMFSIKFIFLNHQYSLIIADLAFSFTYKQSQQIEYDFNFFGKIHSMTFHPPN